MIFPDATRRARGVRLPAWVAPILLGLLCLVVYNANLRTIGTGDTLPARYAPLILWHQGAFDLDANARLVAHGHPIAAAPRENLSTGPSGKVNAFPPSAYWITRTHDGRLVSLYPLVAPLLVAPLYVPAVLVLNDTGWQQPHVDRVAEIMEKISASLLAAIASVLMFLVLRREGLRWALPLSLAFAFGTNTWMISSQALWQHGAGELLVALALLLTLSRATPARTASLGLVCVLMAANRPPDVLLAAAFVLYAVWTRRRDAVWLIAGGILPLTALLYYNLGYVGDIAGAYGTAKDRGSTFFGADWLGPPALLVSPTRGLLVFSPFLVFVALGVARRLRSPDTRWLTVALGLAAVAQFVVYSQADWRAGVSWGARWLTDLLPILVWMLAPATCALRPLARGALIATMAVSIAVQAIGAFWYTKTSDERIYAGDPASMRGAWKPSNTPFIVELGHPPAPRELQCGSRGAIERVGPTVLHDDGTVVALKRGARLEGWAIACGRTPAQVLLLVDGSVVGQTATFTPRPDVDRALHVSSPSGWGVSADTRGVTPGRHVLQLAVRLEPRSDIRIVREAPVMVTAPPRPPAATDLRALAALAKRRLRDGQSGAGYWLTKHTSGPRYAAPRDEMNTYLTAMLTDLIAPFAGDRELGGAAARARRHLAAQIESTGLVRYHGVPDAPTIGTLGCVITPDADDTALAWRISGRTARDPRAPRMLRTLARYRDARGLYRTWLAPRNRYECLDPGRDPNPADLVIQMHVYLMLRELDRPAARKLCTAMRRAAGDEHVWTYYEKTPLVPYLRTAELRRTGCRLPLPTARLARPVAGQASWTELVGRLAASLASPPDANERRAINELLGRLGKDDFALLRRTPPLLFHNDLTATVPRFYWSADAGYALWLRLHAATRPARR